MSYKEVIKALECCVATPFCDKDTDCPYKGVVDCHKKSTYDAIDLINRQQAEIERLHSYDAYKYAKSEAYKEFAERLKGAFCSMCEYDGGDIKDVIDDLLIEMG